MRSTARLPAPFSLPFAVPPVLEPSGTIDGADLYEVTARSAVREILPGLRTKVRGYEGLLPGPTIRSRRDRPIVVRHRNELPYPQVVHLHGGHTPPESDGYPTDLTLPAQGWPQAGGHGSHGSSTAHGGALVQTVREHRYPMRQRASTLWYHDHRMDFTGPAVWNGLAGFHLVDDDEEDALPLPRGDRDLPVMIMDRAFAEDGSFAYPAVDPSYRQHGVTEGFHNGVLGDVLLVNGVPWPFLEVAPVRYRLRLLNACNARRLRVALDPPPPSGPSFAQIGSDGGLLETPQPLEDIYLTPAERFDVVVDFGRYPAGTTVVLTNALDEGVLGAVLQFRVSRPAVRDDTSVPARLSQVERLDPARAVTTRDFVFNKAERGDETVWTIQDQLFDPTVSLAEPRLGDIELWTFTSGSGHHNVHVHLDPFQVVDREGGLNPEDVGWKDSVRLTPNKKVTLAVRFTDYPGRYVFHCHVLEHEDMAMMANFHVS